MKDMFVMTSIKSSKAVERLRRSLHKVTGGRLVREFTGTPDKGELKSFDGSIKINFENLEHIMRIDLEDLTHEQVFAIYVHEEHIEAVLDILLKTSTFNAFRRESFDFVWEVTGEELFGDDE